MASNFMGLCLRRQSCRRFGGRPVEREKLIACIEAARLAPSACNSQPWHFYLVRDPKLVKDVGAATQEAGANPTMDTAKAFVVITEEHARLSPMIRGMIDSQCYAHGDVGAAAALICFEAEEQGLGSCIIGSFNREKICQALGIPIEKRIRLAVALGYPESAAVREKARKGMEEVLAIYE
jgi:nitroreductase